MVSRSRLVQKRELRALTDSTRRIVVHEAPTERAEAEFVVQSIEQLIGGHSFFSLDSGRSDGPDDTSLGFSDFAVLYRTEAQGGAIAEALARAGMPMQRRSHRRMVEGPIMRWLQSALSAEGTDDASPLTERLARLFGNPSSWPSTAEAADP